MENYTERNTLCNKRGVKGAPKPLKREGVIIEHLPDYVILAKREEMAINEDFTLDGFVPFTDCVRIAYQFLDAQKKIKNPTVSRVPIKSAMKDWSGFYVSGSAIDLAISLHPELVGDHLCLNIPRSQWVIPDRARLAGVMQAGATGYTFNVHPKPAYQEVLA
jgi:hypothetical protein